MPDLTPAEERTRELLSASAEVRKAFIHFHQLLLQAVQGHLSARVQRADKNDQVALSILVSLFGNHAGEVDLTRMSQELPELLQDITWRHCEKWNHRYRAGKRREPAQRLSIGPEPANSPVGAVDPPAEEPTPAELAAAADEVAWVLCEFPRRLSARQRTVLELKAQGRLRQEIAAAIAASAATVDLEWARIRALAADLQM